MNWYRIATDGRITLTLHIQPGAKKTEFGGLHGDALKIRLAAPPVDGKANEALIKFVADTLGLPKSAVTSTVMRKWSMSALVAKPRSLTMRACSAASSLTGACRASTAGRVTGRTRPLRA